MGNTNSEAPTLYTDANKSGKAGYKSGNLSKVDLPLWMCPKVIFICYSHGINGVYGSSQHIYGFIICRKICVAYETL